VPVIKAFEFEGRRVRAGDRLTVSPVTAAALHFQGAVSLLHGDLAPTPAPIEPDPVIVAPAPVAKRTTRRTYRRKDLRASA
jgi:hypothetical protein